MGFSRDKSLERVRAESAVAPPVGNPARMGEKRNTPPSIRAPKKGRLACKKAAPAATTPKHKPGARPFEAPLAHQGKQRLLATATAPLP